MVKQHLQTVHPGMALHAKRFTILYHAIQGALLHAHPRSADAAMPHAQA